MTPTSTPSPDESSNNPVAEPEKDEPIARQPDQDGKAHKSPVSFPAPKRPDNEEPDLAMEADLPSDGRDEEGEAMIRALPQGKELSDPPKSSGPTASTS